MKILVAEDDQASRRILDITFEKWGYEVVSVEDGEQAWKQLEEPEAPNLVILDWMMPGMDGLQVLRRLREKEQNARQPSYVILLTAKGGVKNIVEGLEAGANDYLTKPFDRNELRARIRVGERVLDLQQELALRVDELEKALANVKELRGLLPICAYCKKIRSDKDYWQEVEMYVADHTDAEFSHGICPVCLEKVINE